MKLLKTFLMGSPRRGESIHYEVKIHTTMPPGVTISYEEWYGGKWINNLNM